MREIKFRAWDGNNKLMMNVRDLCWDEFGELNYIRSGESTHHLGCLKESVPKRFDKIELMQYTGLKDKNGKEIYEGDIIQNYSCLPSSWDRNYFSITKVYYDNNVAGFSGFIKTYKGDKLSEVEIIGNIYENKDLLNVVN